MAFNEFTLDEHIVSQFLLNNFANKESLICFINIKTIKSNNSKSTVFMFEKDMYEFKTLSGNYFKRNFLEKRFAEMESFISKYLPYVDFYRQMNSNEIIASHLLWALQIIKSKELKNLSYNIMKEAPTGNKEVDKILAQGLYLSVLDSDDSFIEYLNENGIFVDKSILPKSEDKLLDYLLNYSINNLISYIVKAEGNSEFVISDSPIIKNQFGDAKYIFPYSPKYAICFYPIDTQENVEKIPMSCLIGVSEISENMVNKINKYSCKNARQFIACTLDKENYVKELLKEIRGETVE